MSFIISKDNLRKASQRNLIKRWSEWVTEAQRLWVVADYEGCRSILDKVLAIRNQEPTALELYASCLFYEEKLDESRSYAEETLRVNRKSLLAHLILSQLGRRMSVTRLRSTEDRELREAITILRSMELDSAFTYTVAAIVTRLEGNKKAREHSIQYATKALEMEPNCPLALNTRGVSRNYENSAEEAIADFSKAIEVNSKFVNAYYNRGNVYQHLGEVDKAMNDYNRVTELDPDNVNAWFNKGTLLRKKGDISSAMACYRKTIQLDESGGRAYLAMGECQFALEDYVKAQENFTLASQLDGHMKWKAIYERARCYIELDEEKRAMRDLKETLTLNPRFVPALVCRGRYYVKSGKLIKAVENFTSALSISKTPMNDVLYERASAYYILKEHDKAVDDFKNVLSSDEVDEITRKDAETKLGLCYMRVKDYSNAIHMFSRVLDKEPSNVEIREKRAECFLHEKRYNDAISEFDELISIGRGDISLYHFKKAETFVELEELGRGVLEYRASTSLNSRFGIAFFSLGNLLERMERYSEAIDEYEKCLKFEDLDAVCIREHRARCYTILGETNAAIKEYSYCIGKQRRSSLFARRGRLYCEKEKFKKALRDFDAAISIFGDSDETIVNDDYRMVYTEKISVLRRMERYADAEACCTIVLDSYPNETIVRYERAQLRYLQQKYKLAREDFLEVHAKVDVDVLIEKKELLLRLADCHVQCGNREDAIKVLTEVISTNECVSSDIFHARGVLQQEIESFKSASEDFLKALELQNDLYEARFRRGEVLMRMRDYSNAVQCFSELVDSGCPEILKWNSYKKLADCQFVQESYNECMSTYSNILEIDPDDVDALYRRSVCHYHCDSHTEEALKGVSSCLRIDSDYIPGLKFRGKLYVETQKYESALKDFDKLLSLSCSYEELHILRGKAFFCTRRWNCCIMATTQYMADAQQVEKEAYRRRGISYFQCEDYERALSDFEEFNGESDVAVDVLVYWGVVKGKLGDLGEGEKILTRALEMLRGTADDFLLSLALCERGRLRIEMKEPQGAVEDFSAAFKLNEGHGVLSMEDKANWLERRGECHYSIGDMSSAIDDLSRVIELHPRGCVSALRTRASCYMALKKFKLAENDYVSIIARSEDEDPRLFLLRALCRIRRGMVADAIVEKNLLNAHGLDPTDMEIADHLAQVQFERKKYYDAAITYDKIVSSGVCDVDVFCNKGICEYWLDKTEEALESFSQSIEIDDGYVRAHMWKGNTLARKMDFLSAISSFQAALDHNGESVSVLRNLAACQNNAKLWDDAVSISEKWISVNSKDPEAYYSLGVALRNSQWLKESREALNKAIEIAESVNCVKVEGNAYELRGRVNMAMECNDAALSDFSMASKLCPGRSAPWYWSGTVHFERHEWESAMDSFNHVSKVEPRSPLPYRKKAVVSIGLGLYNDARKYLSQAIRVDPKCSASYVERGNINFREGNTTEASRDYNHAVKADKKNKRAYYNRGLLLRSQSKLENAEKDFSSAIMCDGKYGMAYYQRGCTRIASGKSDKAVNDFNEAIEILGNGDPMLFLKRGEALCHLGRYEDALLEFDQVISISPDTGEAFFFKGLALDALKRPEEAKKALEIAVEKDQQFSTALSTHILQIELGKLR